MPPQTPTLGPGARLRAAREAAGLSRRELAERLGISYPTLAEREADRKPIRPGKIYETAMAIGCDPHSIDDRLVSTGECNEKARKDPPPGPCGPS